MKLKPRLMLPILLSCIVTTSLACKAKEEDPFAELDREVVHESEKSEQQKTEELSEYDNFKKSRLAEFSDWRKKYFADYQDFRTAYFKKLDESRDEQISSWGDAESSSVSQQVIYSDDNTTKTVIDYEKNEVRVSILTDSEQSQSSQKPRATEALVAAFNEQENQLFAQFTQNKNDIDNMLKNSHVKDDVPLINNDESELIKKEITKINQQAEAQNNQVERMIDLVAATEKNPDDSNANQQLIVDEQKKILKEKQERIKALKSTLAKLKQDKKRRANLTKKKVVTYTIPLKSKKALAKAKPFVNSVKNESERWDGISLSLMLAIMHTESYFNPKAQSHIPAYGLMQIVPRTAGIDVNRMLYNKDAPMSQQYLFTPDSNIETGVAYVNILNSRYLKKITNPESRKYCIVAAYNTGSGNVAKTFNKDKSRNISKAAKVINKLSPEEVYEHLVNNLPYDETKHYLERVIRRQKIYQELDAI